MAFGPAAGLEVVDTLTSERTRGIPSFCSRGARSARQARPLAPEVAREFERGRVPTRNAASGPCCSSAPPRAGGSAMTEQDRWLPLAIGSAVL